MREQIERRRAELAAEHAKGQQMFAEMQQQQAQLEQTLLRISGAIQLCDEFLTQPQPNEGTVTDGNDS
jgi:hypothetical protein